MIQNKTMKSGKAVNILVRTRAETARMIQTNREKEVTSMALCSVKLAEVSSPFTPDECSELESNINRIIETHKANRQEINRLVFESVAAMTVSEDYEHELESKKGLKRFIGSITGSNKKLQDKINSSRAAAQYASQQTLQRLAEQNLMSFELITAVNNKLNASVVAIEGEINQIYGALLTFFKQSKSDMIQLSQRVERLEKNVNLLNWQNSIEYQMFNGVDYADLDDASKIVCLVRDFYDITEGEWRTSDLLLLKTAMATIDLSPKGTICYQQFVKEIASNPVLLSKLFDGFDLTGIEDYPEYVALSAGIRKSNLLDTSEKYLVDNTVSLMQKHGCRITDDEVKEEMVTQYEAAQGQFDLTSSVNTFDFIMEILYNLLQVKQIQYVRTLDDKMKEAENLFSIYDTERLLPLLDELIEYGYTKAKYILALLYETGCDDLERDDEQFRALLSECISEGYLPALVRDILPIFLPRDDKQSNDVKESLDSLLKLVEDGDSFAANEYARCAISFKWMGYGEDDYKIAIEMFKKAPKVLADYGIGERYDYGQGVEKDYVVSLEYYLRSAIFGYNRAEYEVGLCYEKGYGCDIDKEKAFKYYKRAYEHGSYDAIYKCGWCLSTGFGVDQDDDLSFAFYKEGYEKGIEFCTANLGWCYQNGIGVTKDMEKAKEYYKKAVSMGNTWAQVMLDKYF